MKKTLALFLMLAAVARVWPVSASASAPYSAPPLQPQATAGAAAATAQAASAIEAAAWGQATVQAAQVTAEAQAASTAAAQATATAAAVTAEARAFQVQLTRQAADLDATRAVYELDVTRAAIANVQQAEALAVERERALQPLKLYGLWLLFFLFIALIVWAARRLAPAVEGYLESQTTGGDESLDEPAADEERVFVTVNPPNWAAGPFEGSMAFHSTGVPCEDDVTGNYVSTENWIHSTRKGGDTHD